jgi:membrane protein implicated in regulation of membrane protease activity
MRPYAVVIVLALVAVALGAVELLVGERTDAWWLQAVLPALLIVVLAGLYWRARKENEE